ncbi:hypothetical protein CRENBAI_011521 [Crenichthys baileyi]|uniref:Uncharacterized protein n=1 Tax=Crenichthys baileyi TaxID=28760 RepID=A0AAV9RFP4_9TELE
MHAPALKTPCGGGTTSYWNNSCRSSRESPFLSYLQSCIPPTLCALLKHNSEITRREHQPRNHRATPPAKPPAKPSSSNKRSSTANSKMTSLLSHITITKQSITFLLSCSVPVQIPLADPVRIQPYLSYYK